MENLRYVCDSGPGFTRKKCGNGFIYLNEKGKKIHSRKTLERIKQLAIPPMWENVWICSYENGHLQATGFDSKNRKQYLYHKNWQELRTKNKFDKISSFAQHLPRIRRISSKHLELTGWPKEKVLGLAIQILNDSYIRIGNEGYKKANNSHGLTTLRRKHLKNNYGAITFEYKAKSGQYRKVRLEDKRLRTLVKKCAQLPGHELFRYKEDGKFKNICSQDVNEYLRSMTGEQFSSKDFRTWGGTVLAVEKFQEAFEETIQHTRRNIKVSVVKKVAEVLGNTQKICREYYIHPAIMKAIEVKDDILQQPVKKNDSKYALSPVEKKALKLIENYAE